MTARDPHDADAWRADLPNIRLIREKLCAAYIGPIIVGSTFYADDGTLCVVASRDPLRLVVATQAQIAEARRMAEEPAYDHPKQAPGLLNPLHQLQDAVEALWDARETVTHRLGLPVDVVDGIARAVVPAPASAPLEEQDEFWDLPNGGRLNVTKWRSLLQEEDAEKSTPPAS